MPKSTNKLALKLAAFTLAMFGFGFALVPLYNVICNITGLNGKTGSITEAQAESHDVDDLRLITVEFLANLNQSMNWTFAPEIKTLEVNPGKTYEVSYFAKNHNTTYTVGQAVPSVAPNTAAPFFNKIECFCFSKQMFEPSEEKQMSLRFVVDTELPEHIKTISLAYTFFDVTKTHKPKKI